MLRIAVLTMVVTGCGSDIIIDPAEGGGGAGQGASSAVGGAPSGDGAGGGGGGPSVRTVIVDMDFPPGGNADDVVVLVSSPDGIVSNMWLGGELPVDAPVNDGELISFVRSWGDSSNADSFRVTEALTEVVMAPWIVGSLGAPCEEYTEMTISFTIPEVEGANVYWVNTFGAAYLPQSSSGPGENHAVVRACEGTSSFSLLVLVRDYGNTEVLAFAKAEVPYVAGTAVDVPLELSTERYLVDVVVDAPPGTEFEAKAYWRPGPYQVTADSWFRETVGPRGTSEFQYGPFDIGPGLNLVSVHAPPDFWCELEKAWKWGPFDGAPLHLDMGALADFEPTQDGNVAISSGGDVGDVLLRTESFYDDVVTSHWYVHEDPLTPHPRPERPLIPDGLLPGFQWPEPQVGGERFEHLDFADSEGYAAFAKAIGSKRDGRGRHRIPEYCP